MQFTFNDLFEAWDLRMYGFYEDKYQPDGHFYSEKEVEKLKKLAKRNKHWKCVTMRYKCYDILQQRIRTELNEKGYVESQCGRFMKQKEATAEAL